MNKNIYRISLFASIAALSTATWAATVAGSPVKSVTSGSPAGVQVQASASAPSKPVPPYKSYVYYGDRYRDPFIPLNGDYRNDQSEMERPPQIQSLLLKGIVQDAKGRMALLTSGLNSYILKGGRLYDGRNRMVKKIAGVIKTESVVLIGADRTVREVRTKSPF